MNKKNSFGAVAGKIWSQYSFIFVFLIILVGYAFTIQANGNAFKWSHIAAVLEGGFAGGNRSADRSGSAG